MMFDLQNLLNLDIEPSNLIGLTQAQFYQYRISLGTIGYPRHLLIQVALAMS